MKFSSWPLVMLVCLALANAGVCSALRANDTQDLIHGHSHNPNKNLTLYKSLKTPAPTPVHKASAHRLLEAVGSAETLLRQLKVNQTLASTKTASHTHAGVPPSLAVTQGYQPVHANNGKKQKSPKVSTHALGDVKQLPCHDHTAGKNAAKAPYAKFDTRELGQITTPAPTAATKQASPSSTPTVSVKTTPKPTPTPTPTPIATVTNTSPTPIVTVKNASPTPAPTTSSNKSSPTPAPTVLTNASLAPKASDKTSTHTKPDKHGDAKSSSDQAKQSHDPHANGKPTPAPSKHADPKMGHN